MSQTRENVHIYCCGGAGVNIGKIIRTRNINNADIFYIDSSSSNSKDLDLDDKYTYNISNMDGAGKLRAKTYGAFIPEVEAVLTNFRPSGTLNIIISSLSGGTGSIIAPIIAKELAAKGEPVIVVAIASTTCSKELENSIKTIQTYNNTAIQLDVPIAMYYTSVGHSRSEVDDRVVSFVMSMCLVSDDENTSEFDTTDLNHFINYNKVTGVPVGLSSIVMSANGGEDSESEHLNEKHITKHIASTILMAKSPDIELIGTRPEYLAKVVITDPDYVNNDKSLDIRIDNVVGELPTILAELEAEYEKNVARLKNARFNEIQVVKGTDDGIVL